MHAGSTEGNVPLLPSAFPSRDPLKTTILVVDDDLTDIQPLFTEIFSDKIAHQQYSFYFASNGIEALNMLKLHPSIEVILTDIRMPEMDGLSLLTHLSVLGKPYKAVVMSVYEELGNIRCAMNRGAADFITKPIDFEDLEVTLDRVSAQVKAEKESLQARDRLLEIEKELEIAHKIQQAMIPVNLELHEKADSFDLLGVVLPAKQIGGDFFDFFVVDSEHIGIVIADVSGKGISASLFMATAKTLLRSIAVSCKTTDETLQKVSEILSRDNPSCMFVTAFYATYNITTGKLCYTCAGHTPPYILSKEGNVSKVDVKIGNLPLGIDDSLIKDVPLASECCLYLERCDTLILYTDGVTEAMNESGEEFSVKRLVNTLQRSSRASLQELIDAIQADVNTFKGAAEQSDDIAILCLRHFGAVTQV